MSIANARLIEAARVQGMGGIINQNHASVNIEQDLLWNLICANKALSARDIPQILLL